MTFAILIYLKSNAVCVFVMNVARLSLEVGFKRNANENFLNGCVQKQKLSSALKMCESARAADPE